MVQYRYEKRLITDDNHVKMYTDIVQGLSPKSYVSDYTVME